MKRIIGIIIASILLTSCSSQKIANYKGFPWLNGSSTLNIQHVQIDGKYYIIENNTNTNSVKIITVR